MLYSTTTTYFLEVGVPNSSNIGSGSGSSSNILVGSRICPLLKTENRTLRRVPCSVRDNEGLGNDNKSNIGGIINDYSTRYYYYIIIFIMFLLLLFILINDRIVVAVYRPSG